MDERAMPAGFEHLFEHQDWVRALAVRLSGEPNAADDLVQETWVEVLRARRAPESPRAWLGGIVRNLARNTRRRDGSRDARERRAAQDEHLPSAADLLERAELQRRVLAAVASLDEPSRVVVLLRYAEGLDGERIAARLGVPGSTVRNRLARALEQLRAKLDREYGDRSQWALLLAPRLGDAAIQTLTAGGGIVKAQIALAAGLVAIAAAAWWPDSGSSMATGTPLSATDGARSIATDVDAGREAVEIAGPGAAAAERSVATRVERVLLHGRVVGPTAEEAQEATFRVTGADGVARPFATGVDGAYSVFGLPPGRARASAWLHGFAPFVEEFDVGAATERMPKDFVLQRAFVLPVRFTNRAGGALELTGEAAHLIAAVATRTRPLEVRGVGGRHPVTFGVGLWRPSDEFGRGALLGAAGLLEIREPGPVWVSAVLRERVLEARAIRGDEAEVVFALDPADVIGSLGSVVARVVDARDGMPLSGASLELGYDDATGQRTAADADGRIAVDEVVPGLRRVTIRATGRADRRKTVRVPPAEQLDLGVVDLYPTATVRGRVLDAEGRGIAAHVDVVAERELASARALEAYVQRKASSDGVFEANLVEAGQLLVVARHPELAPAVVRVDARSGTAVGVEIRLVAGTPIELRAAAELRIEIRDALGLPVYAGTVRPPDPSPTRLAPGEYVLRVIREERVVSTQAVSVGTSRLVVEVNAP